MAALAVCAAMLSLSASAGGNGNDHRNRSYGVLVGSGYAKFDAGGAPGDNLYWISAVGAC